MVRKLCHSSLREVMKTKEIKHKEEFRDSKEFCCNIVRSQLGEVLF